MGKFGLVPLASPSTPVWHAVWVLLVVQAYGAPTSSTLDTNSTLINQTQTSQDQPVLDSTFSSQAQTSQGQPVLDSTFSNQAQTSQGQPVLDSTFSNQAQTSQDQPVLDSTFSSQAQTSQGQPVLDSTFSNQAQTSQGQPVLDSTFSNQAKTSQDQPVLDSTFSSQTQTSQDQPVLDSTFSSQTQTSQDQPVLDSTFSNQTQTSQDQPVLDSTFSNQTQTSQDQPVLDSTFSSQTQTSQDQPVLDSTFSNQAQTSQDQPVLDSTFSNQAQTSQDQPVLDSTLSSQAQTSQDQPVLDSTFSNQAKTSQDQPVLDSTFSSQTQTSQDDPLSDSTLVTKTVTPHEQLMSDFPTSPAGSDLQTSVINTDSPTAPLSSILSPTGNGIIAPSSTSQNESLTFKSDSVRNANQMQPLDKQSDLTEILANKTHVPDPSRTWVESSSSSLSLNDYILQLFDPDASYRKCTDVVSSWYDAWRKARLRSTQHSEIHSSSPGCYSDSMSNIGCVSEAPTEHYTQIEPSASFRFRSDPNELSSLDSTETGEVMSYTSEASLPFSPGSEISELIMPETTAHETMSSSSAVDSVIVSSVNYTSSATDNATVEFVSEMYNMSSSFVPDTVPSRFSGTPVSTLTTNDMDCTDCITPSSVTLSRSTPNKTSIFQGPQQTTPLNISLVVSTGTMNVEPDLQSSTSEVPTMIVYYNFSGSIVFCETTIPPKVQVSSSSEFLQSLSDSTNSLSSATTITEGTGNNVGGGGTVTDDTTPKIGSTAGGTTAVPDGSIGSVSSGSGTGSGGVSVTTGGLGPGRTESGGTGTGTSLEVQVLRTTPQPTTRKKSNNVSRSVVIGLVCGVAFCVGFLVMCLCFFKFCCNGPSISPQLYNYKPHNPNDPQLAPSPPTTHRAKKIFVAD
ncbi:probable GPI-anchored adhesin-like protein PGA55 [Haliotis rufescens]|uniref:probable GPI-anchored adhesin-like protein PGA55 n=1 Tax=Haliotis rufescens TaxID=6454 RepID=UPI00201ECA48|nr:probable GPI-anchored adhesin-like protein PGA55 [Haliotis rufescens]